MEDKLWRSDLFQPASRRLRCLMPPADPSSRCRLRIFAPWPAKGAARSISGLSRLWIRVGSRSCDGRRSVPAFVAVLHLSEACQPGDEDRTDRPGWRTLRSGALDGAGPVRGSLEALATRHPPNGTGNFASTLHQRRSLDQRADIRSILPLLHAFGEEEPICTTLLVVIVFAGSIRVCATFTMRLRTAVRS